MFVNVALHRKTIKMVKNVNQWQRIVQEKPQQVRNRG